MRQHIYWRLSRTKWLCVASYLGTEISALLLEIILREQLLTDETLLAFIAEVELPLNSHSLIIFELTFTFIIRHVR